MLKHILTFLGVAILAITSIFLLTSSSGSVKSTPENFVDVDETLSLTKCKNVMFSGFQELCNSDRICKPGLFCSNGKCIPERLLESQCDQDSQCTRSSFGSAKCVAGKCQIVKGPLETCSIDAQCHSGACLNHKCARVTIPSETLPTKVIYCSRYLNALQSVKSCMRKHCGNSGSLFGHFLEAAGSCVVERCHISIKKLTDAALDEFGVRFGQNGKVSHVVNKTPQMFETQAIAQGCPITSTLLVSQFGPLGNDLLLTFSNPIASSALTITNPALIFTNVTTFGTGATAQFLSVTTLKIIFGTGPTAVGGDTLTFVSNALPVAPACGNFISGSVTISTTELRNSFKFQITGPNKVRPSCIADLYLSALTEAGSFRFEWSLDSNAQYVQSSAISTYLSGLPLSTSFIQVSNDTLGALPLGTLRFKLRVSDRFGVESLGAHLVEITGETAAPLCQWENYPTNNKWVVSRANTLIPSITASRCAPSGSNIVLVGSSFTGSATPTLLGQSVSYPANLIADGAMVTVRLDFSVQENFVEVGNCTLTATIEGVRLAPIAAIVGGTDRAVTNGNAGKISLDGSISSDPNGGVLPATYGWNVCKYDLNTGICDNSQGLTSWPGVSALTTAKGELSPSSAAAGLGKFQFTLNYTIGGKSAFANQIITVADANVVAGAVSLVQTQANGFFTFAASFTNPTWTAAVISGIFPITSQTGTRFVVVVDRTKITVSGVLRVTATDPSNGKSASLDVTIPKEIAPFGGSFRVLDSQGNLVSAATPLSSSERYTVEAINWNADVALHYEFFSPLIGAQALSTKSSFTFQPFAVSTTTTTTLKINVAALSVVFGDYIMTSQTLDVVIAPYSLPAGQTFESAANTSLQAAINAAASGNTGGAVSSIQNSLQILNFLSLGRRYETTLTLITLASTLDSITRSITPTPSIVRSIMTSSIDLLRFSSEVRSVTVGVYSASALTNAFRTPFSMDFADISQALIACNRLTVTSVVAVGDYNGLNSVEALQQSASASKQFADAVKAVTRGVGRSIALNLKEFNTPYLVTSGNITLGVHKWFQSVPKNEYVAIPDAISLEAPNGLSGANGIDFVDFIVTKFTNNIDMTASIPSNYNISSASVNVEAWDGSAQTQLRISGSTLFNLKFYGNFTPVQSCLWLDETTNTWSNEGIVAADVKSNVVTCQTNHLTQFASFAGPIGTGPVTINNDLYYLFFLLLLIPLAILIFLGIAVLVVFLFAKIQKGEINLKAIKLPSLKRNNELRANSVGLEDLGI